MAIGIVGEDSRRSYRLYSLHEPSERFHPSGRLLLRIALQYLSDQRGALIRMSWSWQRSRFALGKAWSLLVSELQSRSKWKAGLPDPTLKDLLVAWEKLLEFGWCRFGVNTYCVVDRVVVPLWSTKGQGEIVRLKADVEENVS